MFNMLLLTGLVIGYALGSSCNLAVVGLPLKRIPKMPPKMDLVQKCYVSAIWETRCLPLRTTHETAHLFV